MLGTPRRCRPRYGAPSPNWAAWTPWCTQSREAVERQAAEMVKLRPDDVADAVLYTVTRARRVAVNHILVRASDQTW